ncbi:MAG: PPOX class F420-dependent oxidoreductase [Chloroflexia bacterium]|nr:PPOX class F420-dependent oxidoreductase [Chloroflexia bacterium]
MQHMTDAQFRTFLLHGTRTGKLATVRADGRPHIVPIWFLLDGDIVVFNTGEGSVKARNMRRDPRVSLSVDDERPPFAFVLIEGTVEFVDEHDALRLWATRIAARYMGAEQAGAYGERNSAPGELLVRLTPNRIIAQKDLSE